MKTVRAWCAAVVFVSIGCGGGGGGSPTTVSDFCTQYAQAVCKIAPTCGIQAMTCQTYQQGICNTMAATAVADGKRVFTPANMSNCINKLSSAYGGSAAITPSAMAAIDLACNYVFQGKGVLLTDTCTTQFDCAGATDGSIICDPMAHLCAKKTTKNSGEGCTNPGEVCAQDTFCAPNTAGVDLCTATAKSGDSCATVPCDHTTRCVSGKCGVLAQTGEACTSSADCDPSAPYCDPFASSPICDSGLRFATQSPSCLCIGTGQCPTPSATGTGGSAGGAGGGHGGAGGGAGAGGHAGGGGGAAGGGGGGAGGGTAGASGAAGGGGAAGSGSAGAGGLGIGGLGGI
jgi:hypothetical protein